MINWNQALDRMSRAIRETELRMRARGLCVAVEHEGLHWRMYGDKMRICLEQKPLYEHTAEIRAQYFDKITGLMQAADQEMLNKFGNILDSQIGIGDGKQQ